jgi:hypothetical protein
MTKSIMKKSQKVYANGIHPQAVDEVILKYIKTENLTGDIVRVMLLKSWLKQSKKEQQ